MLLKLGLKMFYNNITRKTIVDFDVCNFIKDVYEFTEMNLIVSTLIFKFTR